MKAREERAAALADARAARGWTQVEMAERASRAMGRVVSQSEISLWESGRRLPTAGTLAILEQVIAAADVAV